VKLGQPRPSKAENGMSKGMYMERVGQIVEVGWVVTKVLKRGRTPTPVKRNQKRMFLTLMVVTVYTRNRYCEPMGGMVSERKSNTLVFASK